MQPFRLSALAAAALLLGVGEAPAVSFTGSTSNVTPAATLGGGGRCGTSRATLVFSPSNLAASGTSNFGAFVFDASHCVVPPPPPPSGYDDGLFTFSFADGSTLFGTYTGVISPTAAPGTLSIVQTHVVAGGTGDFEGAGGGFVSTGTFRFLPGGLTEGQATFSGELTGVAAPIPEPEAWATMIGGFGLLGVALRRRARRPARLPA